MEVRELRAEGYFMKNTQSHTAMIPSEEVTKMTERLRDPNGHIWEIKREGIRRWHRRFVQNEEEWIEGDPPNLTLGTWKMVKLEYEE